MFLVAILDRNGTRMVRYTYIAWGKLLSTGDDLTISLELTTICDIVDMFMIKKASCIISSPVIMIPAR